ncbi:MAG TPA: hypothetical protein VF060_33480 [Trebonia sp.]
MKMNRYRFVAMTVTSCAAGLSLAACSAGITTAKPVTSTSPAAKPVRSPSPTAGRTGSSPTGSSSHTTPASAGSGDTVQVDAPIGSFPIPHGAQVVANMPCGKQVLIELGSVTPAQASTFYTSALPRAGYKVTDNTLTSDPDTGNPQGMAEFTFTGHGYTGLIIAMANLGAEASADPSMAALPSNIAKNALEISLTPPGTSNTSMCPS